MSQILENPTKTVFQDFSFQKEKTMLKSSAMMVNCYVCGKELENGVAISAKHINSKIEFFCDIHF